METHLSLSLRNIRDFDEPKVLKQCEKHTWELQLSRLYAEKFVGHSCSWYGSPSLLFEISRFLCTTERLHFNSC
jgi:hypothetical protein